jgi:hypothetical protein
VTEGAKLRAENAKLLDLQEPPEVVRLREQVAQLGRERDAALASEARTWAAMSAFRGAAS